MDVFNAPRGTRIVYANPNNGDTYDQQMAFEHLIVGRIYTVERTVRYAWRTEVYLMEIPRLPFNSVLFRLAEQK